jgi:hypothetical protein
VFYDTPQTPMRFQNRARERAGAQLKDTPARLRQVL